MHITLVDDSLPFDGYTASSRPLGGSEKAFAALAGALALRGHTVQAFNRCHWGMVIEGVEWLNIDEGRPPAATDVLIASRKPSLLRFLRHAQRRVLWHTGPGKMLERPAIRAQLKELRPLVLLSSLTQASGFEGRDLAIGLLPPAVNPDFLADRPMEPAIPPRAITTTHPAHGMEWLLDLWLTAIHPRLPDAELHLHSMIMAQAWEGGSVDPKYQALAERVLAARPMGVIPVRPQGDSLMADAFRQARVHLYPGHGDDATAFTLLESQAAGLPGVARSLGAAPERIAVGRTGQIAPDDEAFANLALQYLTDDNVFRTQSAEARERAKGWTWDEAARHFEAMLG